jgi:hypothetical protein
MLLRLPIEIRRSIWAFALGDRLLHIKRYRKRRFASATCESGFSRAEIDAQWVTTCCVCPYTEKQLFERSKKPFEGFEQNPHHLCRPAYIIGDEDDPNAGDEKLQGIPIQLLRVCRQVYTEAHPIFWDTNTLSFTIPGDYRTFLEAHRPATDMLLSKLHLDMDWTKAHMARFFLYLPAFSLLDTLENLRSLSIHIARGYAIPIDPLSQVLQENKSLPLREAYVVITNAKRDPPPACRPDDLMPQNERLAKAEQIRNILLNTDGVQPDARN